MSISTTNIYETTGYGAKYGNEGRWGVAARSYDLDGRRIDLQDLLVAITTSRATAVGGEFEPLRSRMVKRNEKLNKLGKLLAGLTEVQSQFDTTKADGKEKKSANLRTYADGDTSVLSELGLPTTNVSSAKRSQVDGWVEKVKNAIDTLNNQVQLDMTRLQSLVSLRDQSYVDASELMKSADETRRNIIQKIG